MNTIFFYIARVYKGTIIKSQELLLIFKYLNLHVSWFHLPCSLPNVTQTHRTVESIENCCGKHEILIKLDNVRKIL